MGSQTLEILRQGVWASLTGGWFYDPHQDVFCNTFHLYLWLFLLCFPFTIYIYFPPTIYLWYLYCAAITVTFTLIKIVNYALHRMYDTTECIQEHLDVDFANRKTEEEGIEMQVLNPSVNEHQKPTQCSSISSYHDGSVFINNQDLDSLESADYQPRNDVENGKVSSTIDLKAEVHRKNSSESSEDMTLQLSCFLNEKPTADGKLDEKIERRHSNFTNSSLSYIPSTKDNEIKATGSLELSYIDKNPNQVVFKTNRNCSVRRFRSTALETSCQPLSLAAHPNSFELIGSKLKNPLPPPSGTLIRNNHNLNLCFGSEIVYPIAEQSDEHHPPDTDVDSLTQNISDSDYDEDEDEAEIRGGSRSPLLLHTCVKVVQLDDGASTTSKDALINVVAGDDDASNHKEVDVDDDISVVEVSSPIKRGYGKRYKRRRKVESKSSSSLVELDLDWLFDDENQHLRHCKDDWCETSSATTTTTNTCVEQDVSKVLQDPISTRSLGAIPKKRNPNHHQHQPQPSTSSSSSHVKQRKNIKYKYKQNCMPPIAIDHHDIRPFINTSSIEGLECLVNQPGGHQRYRKINLNATTSSRHRSLKPPELEPSNSPYFFNHPMNNELSTLLPAAPILQAILASRREFPLLPICLPDQSPSTLRHCRLKRSNMLRFRDREAAIATSLSSGLGTHCAKNFNDTSDGSVHCFLDEHGNWITYTFDEKASNSAQHTPGANLYVLEAASPTSTSNTMIKFEAGCLNCDENTNNTQQIETCLIETPHPIIQEPDLLNNNNNNNNNIKAKIYYKLKLLPKLHVKIEFDRLKLLALLDRNLTFFEMILSAFLGILVSVLGAITLHHNIYNDLSAFIFCFIIASSQYSLLKSVQPDAASPTHGFNRIIAYSRPVYFCIFTGLLLGLEFIDVEFIQDIISKFILAFPLLFSIGLFPQINTFVLYVLEQIDMHVFGGNAMPSLLAGFYCVFRSIIAVISMYGFVYGALCEPKTSQHILFSIFCACLTSCAYHLSRTASDPQFIWNIIKKQLYPSDIYKVEQKDDEVEDDSVNKSADPLPGKLQETVNARLGSDALICTVIAVLTFGLHASTIFTALQPELSPVLWCTAGLLGFILHYLIPQMRKQLPWLCVLRPILRNHEEGHHNILGPAKIMWFETIYVYLCLLERNIIYPLLFLAVLTEESPKIAEMFGNYIGALIITVCGLKCLRNTYSQQNCQYLILTFTALFYKYDYSVFQESFLIDYFIIAIVYHKTYELLLKIQFIVTYIAPWQITWGSAFHAFAQPFSVPHSAMLFLQALISALLSTPLNPFLGSAIFLTSYVRPIKFWERDYNTRRVDHSNTPLSSHLERNLGADDNNLNSIFYEHLTRSLQHSLCGDLLLGRWGIVNQGDCFVLASDYLNCLVHIIELGNGLVTFQMRGLEFKGTYCQQREVEAITEGVSENDGCCCCHPGHLPRVLSVNAAFTQRWLAWEVTAAKYVLEGYSITDNSAASMLQVFDFRKVLVTYYVKSIIFYTIRSPKLDEWLNSPNIAKALQPIHDANFVDLDPVFNNNIDEDFDLAASGMTRTMFYQIYNEWIVYCIEKSGKNNIDATTNSTLVVLCFALSLLGRRSLGAAASHNTVSNVEFFLFGLHALFKGDFRITCTRDEWVFIDMDFLKTVVAPGVRMSLKLHQDHFMSPDEYEDLGALYDAIVKHEEELVISHEGDPAWRNAILSGTQSLLALRHVLDEGTDEYKIIMLNKRYLTFRVIKINKECVRGLWAGQQQELVYLRNRNPERGSIQNAKQALRNIINSSCDQPIGYPIYVSPLTTSYAETNEQLCALVGGNLSLAKIRNYIIRSFRRIRKRCGEGCSSGASATTTTRDELGLGNEGVYAMSNLNQQMNTNTNTTTTGSDGSHLCGSMGRGSSLSRISIGGNRGSLASMGKPTSSTLASLAGLFKEQQSVSRDEMKGEGEAPVNNEDVAVIAKRVKIIDANLVYDCINLGRRIDVSWPNELMRSKGGRSYWRDWIPEVGMEGQIVHKWVPLHKDINRRSHVDRTILLIQIDEKFVPIAEQGVQIINNNEE